MSKVREGRSVWCSGHPSGVDKGWLEIREVEDNLITVEIRAPGNIPRTVIMRKDQALTFCAQGMNLARRKS